MEVSAGAGADTDTGFDSSILGDFRARLVAGGAEQLLLEALLERCKAAGLVKLRGRQRIDATAVLAAVRAQPARPGAGDLTPTHELTCALPAGTTGYGDKGDNAAGDEATILADTGARLAPLRKANLAPNLRVDKLALREYRKRIAVLYSQCEAMGVQCLRARTNPGLELKDHASLLALTIANAD